MVKILEAKPKKDFTLEISLDNSRSGLFDVKPYLDKGIFRELKDWEYFSQAKVRGRSVYWPHEQDFSADTIDKQLIIKGKTEISNRKEIPAG